jgi:hypothetical protein
MVDDLKQDNPFEPPEADSKPQYNSVQLRGDVFVERAYRISNHAKILLFLGFVTLTMSGTGMLFSVLWLLGEILAILFVISSFFYTVSNRIAGFIVFLQCTASVVIASVVLAAFYFAGS